MKKAEHMKSQKFKQAQRDKAGQDNKEEELEDDIVSQNTEEMAAELEKLESS